MDAAQWIVKRFDGERADSEQERGEAGLLGDFAVQGVPNRLARLDGSGGNLRPGVGHVPMVENKQRLARRAPGCDVSDDFAKHRNPPTEKDGQNRMLAGRHGEND